MKKLLFTIASVLLLVVQAQAQLAKDNKCKFLGNITTTGDDWQEYCDWSSCNLTYSDFWDQVTCENATKWGSVHQGFGRFNWSNADRTYNYCKEKGIIFKFHALIWGSQHPSFIESLSVDDTKKAIIEWFDEVQKHYPDLTIIDVVNEAIYSGSDYHSPYKQTKIIEALGSLAEDRAQKETGTRPSYNCNTNGYPNTNSYQWLAEAFRLARERWPNATLIYNDYNTFQWQKTEFINLVNGIKACGGPIDAAGNQAHDLNDMSGSQFKSALEEIHNKTQLPQYITEYDICKKDDQTFETRYKEQFPIMWEADYVPGVTLWGWIYGKTWVNDGDGEDGKGASGLVRDCKHRSAFTWLQNYMKDNVAKNASATVCGKAAGGPRLTVSTSETAIELGQSVTISAELEGASSISYSVSGVQIGTGSEIVWTPTEAGEFTVEVSAESSDGTVKRTVSIKVVEVGPFGGEPASIPGKIEAENYDKGFAGEAFFDLSDGNNCDDYTDYYRSDDIDIKKISDGIAIGHCQKGEWMNYTINVTEDGEYDVVLRVGTGNSDGGKMTISIGDIVKEVSIDQTGEWGSFAEVSVGTMKLTKGVHVLKLSIDKDWIDIDWISFEKDPSSVADYANNNVISVIPNPASSKIEIIGAGYDVKVEFVSLAGSVVKESNKAEISLGDVANGVYMLRITTPNETVVKKLVVKK
ncbi:MAG: carbohydrate-binding protein [Bacteroidales bacterium]|jgi:GH35 family endo-1,4-beta-xylanase|nr:carbohydrate-binding protein [Bacteroidales bacterium]